VVLHIIAIFILLVILARAAPAVRALTRSIVDELVGQSEHPLAKVFHSDLTAEVPTLILEAMGQVCIGTYHAEECGEEAVPPSPCLPIPLEGKHALTVVIVHVNFGEAGIKPFDDVGARNFELVSIILMAPIHLNDLSAMAHGWVPLNTSNAARGDDCLALPI
jgi:hypothetical protein